MDVAWEQFSYEKKASHKKDKYYSIPLVWILNSGQNHRDKSRILVVRGWGMVGYCLMDIEFQFN